MYTANKPIFEFLYAYIRDNFLEGKADSQGKLAEKNMVFYASESERPKREDRFFRRFMRGPFLLKDLPRTEYPCGWLELGEIRDIEFDRAPDGYCYGLRYQMPVFTGVQQPNPGGSVPLETFRFNSQDPRGLGDIVSEIVEKAWAELHRGFATGGNFQFVDDSFYPVLDSSGKLSLSDVNWWVKQWSVAVNGDIVDTISEWKDVIHNAPTARAKTINWDFTIFEQEGLI